MTDIDALFEPLRTRPKVDKAAAKARADGNYKEQTIVNNRRKTKLIELLESGSTLREALASEGVRLPMPTYSKWRERDRHFARNVDVARARRDVKDGVWNGTHASFAETYFGISYTDFQLHFIEELENLPLGSLLMTLWPPDHGKTTTAENYISTKIALQPNWRTTVASEGLTIAKKILGRIKHRMEPGGPFPEYVRRWGPFKPPEGVSRGDRMSQPWGADHFNVFKKNDHDERDYSVQALGYKSSIVSTRCDHLHIDDLQSTKTIGLSDQMEEWVRQDALSRPGQHGITTIAGTRVGEDDVYSRLADDPALDGILKVLRFPAITTDYITGEQKPLWPARYNLDQLERQRKIVGEEAWDRNYMQNPGASNVNATYTQEIVDRTKNEMYSLHDRVGQHGSTFKGNQIVYVGLDPALGGKNCVIACEVMPEGKLLIRRIREDINLRSNEQIMQGLATVVNDCNQAGHVSDVVIEAMNFQRGLSRDERLLDMQHELGFAVREHLTGWNKYQADIGVASMVSSFMSGEIIIPWHDDPYTRTEMEELIRQLRAWRPGMRGTKLRQDRVMALWFVWIVWRQRWKSADALQGNATSFKRQGIPWKGTKSGLVIPVGARV